MFLDIFEPLVVVKEVPSTKRALKYETKIAVSGALDAGMDALSSLPSPPHDDPDRGRRCRRR
jgi:hypothetical protein